MEVGVLENKEKMIDSNDKFYNVLSDKDYEVNYNKFCGGHTYVSWRGSFAEALIAINKYNS